jgi:hypothetical protein
MGDSNRNKGKGMKVALIGERRHKAIPLLFIGFIFLAFILSGCGREYSSFTDTGSYTCTLIWPENVPAIETTFRTARSIDCDAAGVATVAFDFYDGSGTYLIGDEWDCSIHQGTVNDIPAGANRKLVATAKDSSGTGLYWGEQTGITIIAGQTNQGGEIEMHAFLGFNLVGTYPTSKNINSIFVVGGKAYIGNGGNGLVVLDVSAPSNPRILRQYEFEDAEDVIVEDEIAYVVKQGQLEGTQIQNDTLLIIDLSSTSNPIKGEYIHSTHGELAHMCKAENVVYLMNSEKMTLIDVHIPSSPVKIGEFEFGMTNLAYPRLCVVDYIAYVAGGSGGLRIIDVSNPSDIKEIEQFDTPCWAIDIKVINNIAYITGWEGGLVAIDVRDPSNPIKIDQYKVESPRIAIDLSVVRNVAYMTYIVWDDYVIDDSGIIAVSLNDPYRLTKIDEYAGMNDVNAIFGLDSHLYVASENDLYIFETYP